MVLGICALLLVGSGALASRVRFDSSFEAFFDTGDPTYAAYQRYREDFGSDEVSYLVYEAPGRTHGVFDLEVMRAIWELTEALESEVPFVDEVTSLANAEYVEGVEEGLEVYPLLEDPPESQAELLTIRDKVLRKPLYVGGLVSADARYGAITLEMDRSSVDPLDEIRFDPQAGDGLDNLYPQVSHRAIEEILARYEATGIRFYHTGDVPLNAFFNEISASEGARLAGVTALVISLLLLAFFRSLLGVLGPVLVVGLALVVTQGVVGWIGWELDFMYQMLPTLVITVGVADAVHIIAEFRAFHAELGDRREAARRTLSLVGTPCLLTSLTTAAGFASMSIAPVKAIAHFAVYSAVGVLAAFLLTVTLLFVLLSLGPRRPPRRASEVEIARAKGGRAIQALLSGLTDTVLRHRRAILAVSAGVFLLALPGIAQLRVESNYIHEFRESHPVRRATEVADRVMGGTMNLVYLFDGEEPDGVKQPALLRDLDALQSAADGYPAVRKTYSLGDLLKDINRSFHAEDEAYYVLPERRDLVAQYLLVYEISGGDEISSYVSSDYARANLELRFQAVETSRMEAIADALESELASRPEGAAPVYRTGVGALWLRLQDFITASQIRGFTVAFAVIALLLCFIFRSVKTGMIAMVPNLAPVVLTLGGMGWLGVPLDYAKLLIGSVAIGISVDDTIHHVTRFHLEFKRRGRYLEALRAANRDVGRALLITSVVLVAGFLVFLLGSLASTAAFGALLATTVAVALIADLLLMPALVLTFRPFGPERERPASAEAAQGPEAGGLQHGGQHEEGVVHG